MKEYILELLTKTKNLDKFFIYLSKQEDPQELRMIADKQITRTFASSFTRDKATAEIIGSKEYKEFISNGKNSLISIFEQKKYGGNVFIYGKSVHPATDFVSKTEGFMQVKRKKLLTEQELQYIIAKYEPKGITTVRIFLVEDPYKLIGEYKTNAGMQVIVESESSYKTKYNQEECEEILQEFRKSISENTEILKNNNEIAAKMANKHNELILSSEKIWECCDCVLNTSIVKNLEKDQNIVIQNQAQKIWQENRDNIQEINFEKQIVFNKKNRNDF